MKPSPPPLPWWDAGVHADRRPFLLARNRIVRALRGWFEAQGFTEVDPCALQRSPGNETHLHALATDLRHTDGTHAARLHLHTSPEFAAKKLLAAGERAVVCFAHVWRDGERGPLHHPEFTMLEWYRAGAPYTVLMDDCQALVRLAAEAAGTKRLDWRGQFVDAFAPLRRLSVADAFTLHAGIDLLPSLLPGGATDLAALAGPAAAAGVRVAPDDGWSDVFARVLTQKIEPRLGFDRPTVLDRYPLAEAALARPCADDPRLAERFELYACGVELANGFGELTDATEQRRRFVAQMDERQRLYGERYPLDEELLAALPAMPPASGIALGLDRLAMLATGATRIEQVLWAPVPDG